MPEIAAAQEIQVQRARRHGVRGVGVHARDEGGCGGRAREVRVGVGEFPGDEGGRGDVAEVLDEEGAVVGEGAAVGPGGGVEAGGGGGSGSEGVGGVGRGGGGRGAGRGVAADEDEFAAGAA